LRRDMWELVRQLKQTGVTIILTTHYIEEAEEMADRIGIITKGEIQLVDTTAALMKKLGKKQLILQLTAPLSELPASLAIEGLTLSKMKDEITYTYDSQSKGPSITEVLNLVSNANIHFKDLRTTESSLEDIFVDLVDGEAK